jgi:hypothetical protein
MTKLEVIKVNRDSQIQVIDNLKLKGYARRGIPQYQKAIYSKELRTLDSLNIQIEKIEYNQAEVIKVLKELGLIASKKQTTAIRGYNTYSKGYEVDNKYSVSYISLHSISEAIVEKINTKFSVLSINATATSQGIILNKI